MKGTKVLKYIPIIFRVCDRPLDEIAWPQWSSRQFHFVQWFVITATNMIHVGSDSHPKRQANYGFSRQRSRKTWSWRSTQTGPSRSRELYDLTRRHRLIIWIFLSLLQSPGYESFTEWILDSSSCSDSYRSLPSSLIQAQRFGAISFEYQKLQGHALFFYMDHLLRSRSRFRKSQSSVKKIGYRTAHSPLPCLLIVQPIHIGNWM